MTPNALTVRYRITDAGFVRAYIVTMRPYLMFVSGITGIVGMSFALYLTAGKTLLIAVASFLSYGFGQALTDCFQTDTDSISAPYRPLTQGIVSKRQVLTISSIGLLGCVAIFSICNPLNLVLGVLAGIGLATYTPFKRRWWAGPFYNAWIVGVLCLMAFLAGGATASAKRSTDFLLTLSAVVFGYANFVLTGYFKDVTADRATGYNTLPVVYGQKLSAWVSDVFSFLTILSVLAIIVWMHIPSASMATLVFIGVSIFSSILAQVRLHRVETDEEAHRAISPVVHSYILLLSGVAVMQKSDWSIPLALFYSAFVLVMKFRPEKSQI